LNWKQLKWDRVRYLDNSQHYTAWMITELLDPPEADKPGLSINLQRALPKDGDENHLTPSGLQLAHRGDVWKDTFKEYIDEKPRAWWRPKARRERVRVKFMSPIIDGATLVVLLRGLVVFGILGLLVWHALV